MLVRIRLKAQARLDNICADIILPIGKSRNRSRMILEAYDGPIARDQTMTRDQAIPYISYCVDDALAERDIADMPANARLVGWQCGFEPMFVAVWSYLGSELDESEAEEIATDLLTEKNWFHEIKPADYVI